jgi:hypothetical protein
MLKNQIPLGSKTVWLLGRIFSFLIIIPPLLGASNGSLPIPVLVAVLVFWILMLLQMRGWSYGHADPDGIAFVSWIKQKHLRWTEVGGVNSSSIGISIQRGFRGFISGSLLFNRWSIPLSARMIQKHQETNETLQRWWLYHHSNNPKVDPI